MHVSCRGRGILELDLNSVFSNEEERVALAVVKSLDLSHNELKQLNGLQPFSSLTHLDLRNNKLCVLQGLPLSLQRLNVAHNQLTSLDGLAALPFLQELDATDNKLTSVTGLPRAAPLKVLRLANNRLPSCQGLEPLGQLESLDLDSNYISLFDDVRPLMNLPALRSLVLRGNPVAEHPSYRTTIAQLLPTLTALDGQRVTRRQAFLPTSPHPAVPLSAAKAATPAGQRRAASAPRMRTDLSTSSVNASVLMDSPAANQTLRSNLVRSQRQAFQTGTFSPQPVGPEATVPEPPSFLQPQPYPGPLRAPEHGSPYPAHSELDDFEGSGAMHPSDLTLGPGAPLIYGASQLAAGGGAARPTINASLNSSGLGSMSFGNLKYRADARRVELTESKRRLEVDVTELRRLLEEEYKLTGQLQKAKKKAEAEISDVRRVLAEELQKLNQLRDANRELEQEAETQRGRAEKFSKDYKYAHQKLKEERRKRVEDLEKAKVNQQAAMQGLRGQLSDVEAARSQAMEANRQLKTEALRLQEYIRVLEAENAKLALTLSKYENATYGAVSAATSQANLSMDDRGPHASSVASYAPPPPPPAAPAAHAPDAGFRAAPQSPEVPVSATHPPVRLAAPDAARPSLPLPTLPALATPRFSSPSPSPGPPHAHPPPPPAYGAYGAEGPPLGGGYPSSTELAIQLSRLGNAQGPSPAPLTASLPPASPALDATAGPIFPPSEAQLQRLAAQQMGTGGQVAEYSLGGLGSGAPPATQATTYTWSGPSAYTGPVKATVTIQHPGFAAPHPAHLDGVTALTPAVSSPARPGHPEKAAGEGAPAPGGARPETLSAIEFAVSLKKWLLTEMDANARERQTPRPTMGLEVPESQAAPLLPEPSSTGPSPPPRAANPSPAASLGSVGELWAKNATILAQGGKA